MYLDDIRSFKIRHLNIEYLVMFRATLSLETKQVRRRPHPSPEQIYGWALREALQKRCSRTGWTSTRTLGHSGSCVPRTWHTVIITWMEPSTITLAQRTLLPCWSSRGPLPLHQLAVPDMRRPNDAYAQRRSAIPYCRSHPALSVPCRSFPLCAAGQLHRQCFA